MLLRFREQISEAGRDRHRDGMLQTRLMSVLRQTDAVRVKLKAPHAVEQESRAARVGNRIQKRIRRHVSLLSYAYI